MADEDEVAINYRIPAELHARCKQLAAWKGQTLRVWVTRALEEVAERQESDRDSTRRRR
jgi:predicted HicB family RNase H-like nuclease